MHRRFLISVVAAVLAGLCMGQGCLGPQEPEPEPKVEPQSLQGPGFTAMLPAGSQAVTLPVTIVGADFLSAYDSDSGRYVFYIADPDTIPIVAPDPDEASHFVGIARTSSGDLLLMAAGGGTQYVIGWLPNNTVFFAGGLPTDPLWPFVLASIDLIGTDGSSINELAKEDSTTLIAPAGLGYVALSDNTLYDLRWYSSDEREQASRWVVGDSVMRHGQYLTKVGEWRSIRAEYVGMGNRLSLTTFELIPDSWDEILIALSNGFTTTQFTAYGTPDWRVGDGVLFIENRSPKVLFNLRNGETFDLYEY